MRTCPLSPCLQARSQGPHASVSRAPRAVLGHRPALAEPTPGPTCRLSRAPAPLSRTVSRAHDMSGVPFVPSLGRCSQLPWQVPGHSSLASFSWHRSPCQPAPLLLACTPASTQPCLKHSPCQTSLVPQSLSCVPNPCPMSSTPVWVLGSCPVSPSLCPRMTPTASGHIKHSEVWAFPTDQQGHSEDRPVKTRRHLVRARGRPRGHQAC